MHALRLVPTDILAMTNHEGVEFLKKLHLPRQGPGKIVLQFFISVIRRTRVYTGKKSLCIRVYNKYRNSEGIEENGIRRFRADAPNIQKILSGGSNSCNEVTPLMQEGGAES